MKHLIFAAALLASVPAFAAVKFISAGGSTPRVTSMTLTIDGKEVFVEGISSACRVTINDNNAAAMFGPECGDVHVDSASGHASNEAFLTDTYEKVLHRKPYDAAAQGWVVMLDNGYPRADVEYLIRKSTEAPASR